MSHKITSFAFEAGRPLGRKFEIVRRLGGGWEGEVYIVRENLTGIERAAKFFFPHRNKNNRAVRFYAKKLHKLRQCSILIQYLTQEVVRYKGQDLVVLISDYVEGETLVEFLARQPGQRLHAYQALHLLHSLAKGIEEIHRRKEYHGDLHTGNVIVQRVGLEFDLKLVDMFHWGAPSRFNIRQDVFHLVRLLYDVTGGAKFYSRQPQVIKSICCGLKDSLIAKKFSSAGKLREHLETLVWE